MTENQNRPFGVAPVAEAGEWGITTSSAPPPMGQYLKECWERRDLAIVLPWMKWRTRDSNNVLGSAWVVLTPLLQAGIFYLVFGILLADATRGVPNVVSFLIVGIFVFQFLQGAISQATGSVVSNLPLLRTLYFPRALLPIQAVMLRLYQFVPAMIVAMVVIMAVGERPSLSWLAFPLIVVSMTLFCFGAALISARLNVSVRDWSSLLPFLFRLLRYTSSAIFPIERFFDDDPFAIKLMAINPFFSYLSISRWSLLGDTPLRWTDLVSITVWPIVAIVFGVVVFKSAERRFGGIAG